MQEIENQIQSPKVTKILKKFEKSSYIVLIHVEESKSSNPLGDLAKNRFGRVWFD
jgi:hypothetical protein